MKFDASLLVVVAIFGVAYFLLKIFFFDRLLRILQQRERFTDEARSVWQQANERAQAALDAERQRLLTARRETAARREALRREAMEQRQALLDAAKAEAQGQIGAARAELAAQRQREEQTLASRATALAARITERLVGRAV